MSLLSKHSGQDPVEFAISNIISNIERPDSTSAQITQCLKGILHVGQRF
jgi:hypothetical protein